MMSSSLVPKQVTVRLANGRTYESTRYVRSGYETVSSNVPVPTTVPLASRIDDSQDEFAQEVRRVYDSWVDEGLGSWDIDTPQKLQSVAERKGVDLDTARGVANLFLEAEDQWVRQRSERSADLISKAIKETKDNPRVGDRIVIDLGSNEPELRIMRIRSRRGDRYFGHTEDIDDRGNEISLDDGIHISKVIR